MPPPFDHFGPTEEQPSTLVATRSFSQACAPESAPSGMRGMRCRTAGNARMSSTWKPAALGERLQVPVAALSIQAEPQGVRGIHQEDRQSAAGFGRGRVRASDHRPVTRGRQRRGPSHRRDAAQHETENDGIKATVWKARLVPSPATACTLAAALATFVAAIARKSCSGSIASSSTPSP